MSIICPKCKKKHTRIYLSFICDCGQNLGIEHEEIFAQLENICVEYKLKIENETLAEIRRIADRIVSLILNNECTKEEIEIEKQKLKQLIKETYPEKMHLYKLIYEPRFKRFCQQFRDDYKDKSEQV
ncbi:MAG: hypothetical protein ABIG64_04520 [Candidatus Omnitrophota bacterium]